MTVEVAAAAIAKVSNVVVTCSGGAVIVIAEAGG